MSARLEIKKGIFGGYSVRYPCPHCGSLLKSSLDAAGEADVCPDCGREFVVPGAESQDHIREARKLEQTYLQEEKDRKRQQRLARSAAKKAERMRVAAEEQKRDRAIWEAERARAAAAAKLRNDLRNQRTGLTPWGWTFIIGGLCVACFFLFIYDTTVYTHSEYIRGLGRFGGNRVHNIGLQQNRTLGSIAGMIAAAVGAVMVVVDAKIGQAGRPKGNDADEEHKG